MPTLESLLKSGSVPFKRRSDSRDETREPVDTVVHNPVAGFAAVDLILQADENGAVFLKLIAIEVQFLNRRGVLVHDDIQAIDGLHTSSLITMDVD